MRSPLRWVALCALLLAPAAARADEPAPPPPPPPTENPPPGDVDLRLRKLEQASEAMRKSNDELRAKVEQLIEEREELKSKVDQLAPLASKITGYLDFGFFWVQSENAGVNTGAGIRPDTGYKNFPKYNGIVPESWVFYGDPLSTAINSRGEPATTGNSRAVTFDPVQNGGKASFIVNSLTLSFFSALTDSLTFTGLVDLVPRGRDVSANGTGTTSLGDFLDVKLAYLEYIVPVKRFSLSLFAGKMDSVLGYEYRLSESPDRIGVTPSLICRYTCGRPLGLKARAKFFDDRLIVNVALTNGSSFSEYFPFYDEIDFNNFKTVQGRVSYRFPVGAGLEIGASGAFGAQDNQPIAKNESLYTNASPDTVYQWHYGFDLHLDTQRFDLAAEFVQGRAEGLNGDQTSHFDPDNPTKNDCALAPCLQYLGAYGQVAYRLFNWLMPYGRIDYRNAVHRDGASFVYSSDLMRATVGARVEINASLMVKAETTFIHQLGPAQIAPDPSIPGMFVVTSSLVARF